MQRLRITIFDLVTKGPTGMLYARIINPNSASIMPQVIGVWCEELGHRVHYVCYTGLEQFSQNLLDETDVLIIGAFSRSAQAAYAISNLFRRHGAVTVDLRCQRRISNGCRKMASRHCCQASSRGIPWAIRPRRAMMWDLRS